MFLFTDLPIVTKEWLLACFDKLVKVPFENYFIKTSANSTTTETPTLPKRSSQRVTRRNASQLIADQAHPENSPLISIQPVTTNQPVAAKQLQLPTLSTPHRKEDEKMSKKQKISETPKLRHNRISELNAMSPGLSQSPGITEDADSLRSKYTSMITKML